MASATPGRGAANSRHAMASSPFVHEHLARLLIVLASAVEADASANSQLPCSLFSGAGSERAANSGTAYAHRAEAGAAHDASDCGDGLDARASPAPANSREPTFSGEGACLERATSWADHVRDGSTGCDPSGRIAAATARANSTARGAPVAELGGGGQPAPLEPAARSSARSSLSGEPNLWDAPWPTLSKWSARRSARPTTCSVTDRSASRLPARRPPPPPLTPPRTPTRLPRPAHPRPPVTPPRPPVVLLTGCAGVLA